MMIRFWNAFVKITGWPVQWVCFRTRVCYQNKAVQGRRIQGPAIVVCNHTSVFDYVVLLFVFFGRTLRVQMAELQFEKPFLGRLLKRLGGIRVDRNSHDFRFVAQSEDILRKGGVVGVFPESRLPRPEEERPLPFKSSVAYLALSAGVPVIPVYTNGSYFQKKHASVVIGEPMEAAALTDPSLSEKENLERVAAAFRERVIALGKELETYEK